MEKTLAILICYYQNEFWSEVLLQVCMKLSMQAQSLCICVPVCKKTCVHLCALKHIKPKGLKVCVRDCVLEYIMHLLTLKAPNGKSK